MEQVTSDNSIESSFDKRKLNPPQQNAKKRRKVDSNCKTQHDAANYFAETYFNRVKNALSSEGFEKFISILCSYDDDKVNRDEAELYKKINVIFETESRPDLAEQFIVFIRPHIASQLKEKNNYDFLHKAWSLFNGIDSHHFSRMLNVLEGLTSNPNVKLADVESVLRPLFKGQTNVVQTICQLFASSKPPTKDLNEYETVLDINCDRDLEFEHVWVPRMQTDRSCPGHSTCQCVCHKSTAKPLCSACNIRFFNGRIYVQRGKEIRSARLHFGYGVSSEEMQHRLHPAYYAQQQALLSRDLAKQSPNKGERKDRKISLIDGSGSKIHNESNIESGKSDGKSNALRTDKNRTSLTPPHNATPPHSTTPQHSSTSSHVFYEENNDGLLEFYREESDIEDEDLDIISDSEIMEHLSSSTDHLSSPTHRTPPKFSKQLGSQSKKNKSSSKKYRK